MNDQFSYIPPSPEKGINIERHTFIISADLGQANDWTAISVIEKVVKGYGVLNQNQLYLRHIERPSIGTEYPAIVDRIAAIFKSPALEEHRKAVVIDYTGLGRPVYDMMRERGFNRSLNAISITSGMDMTYTNGHYDVPKRELVTSLQIALQNNLLKVAKGLPEANAFIEEMSNFQTKISDAGRDTYNGRSGVHDDIVMSVAMGVWLAGERHIDASFIL